MVGDDPLFDAAENYLVACNVVNRVATLPQWRDRLTWAQRVTIETNYNRARQALIVTAAEAGIESIESGLYADTPMKACHCRGPADYHDHGCTHKRWRAEHG